MSLALAKINGSNFCCPFHVSLSSEDASDLKEGLLRLEKLEENGNKVSNIHFLSGTGFQRPWAAK